MSRCYLSAAVLHTVSVPGLGGKVSIGMAYSCLCVYHCDVFQRQAKYSENKLKCTKARNDYLLNLAATNAAVSKYYIHDVSDLIDVSACVIFLAQYANAQLYSITGSYGIYECVYAAGCLASALQDCRF